MSITVSNARWARAPHASRPPRAPQDPDFLGTASLDITQAPVEQELVVPLSRKSKGVEGSLVLKLSKAEAPRPPKGPPTAPKGVPPPTAHAGRAPPPPPEAPKAPGSAANGAHSLGAPAAAAQHGPVLAAPKAPLDRLPAPSPRAPGEAPPAIFVTVIELEGLCARAGAAANPFVTMRCGSEVMHSSVKVAADRPVWDERFLFLLKTLECDLSFDVWDKGETGQDLLGRGRVGLSDVVFGFPMPVALKTGLHALGLCPQDGVWRTRVAFCFVLAKQCRPSAALGYPVTAFGYPPTAVGYPPTAVGYPPTAVGCPSSTVQLCA